MKNPFKRTKIVIKHNEGKSTAQNWGAGVQDESTTTVNIFVITSQDPESAWEKIVEQLSKQKSEAQAFII